MKKGLTIDSLCNIGGYFFAVRDKKGNVYATDRCRHPLENWLETVSEEEVEAIREMWER